MCVGVLYCRVGTFRTAGQTTYYFPLNFQESPKLKVLRLVNVCNKVARQSKQVNCAPRTTPFFQGIKEEELPWVGLQPTTLCSLSERSSYQGNSAGRGSNLQHNTKANLKQLCHGTVHSHSVCTEQTGVIKPPKTPNSKLYIVKLTICTDTDVRWEGMAASTNCSSHVNCIVYLACASACQRGCMLCSIMYLVS